MCALSGSPSTHWQHLRAPPTCVLLAVSLTLHDGGSSWLSAARSTGQPGPAKLCIKMEQRVLPPPLQHQTFNYISSMYMFTCYLCTHDKTVSTFESLGACVSVRARVCARPCRHHPHPLAAVLGSALLSLNRKDLLSVVSTSLMKGLPAMKQRTTSDSNLLKSNIGVVLLGFTTATETEGSSGTEGGQYRLRIILRSLSPDRS